MADPAPNLKKDIPRLEIYTENKKRRKKQKKLLYPLKKLNEWELELAKEEELNVACLEAENLEMAAIAKAKILAHI